MNHDAIRDHLRAQIAAILARNEKVGDDRRHVTTPLGADWADNAILLENDDVLEALDNEGRARVAQLRAALGRLDAGSYGVCTRCKGDIAAARLAALPEVAVCIACAEIIAEQGRTTTPR